MQHATREVAARRRQRFLADVTMNDAQLTAASVEKNTLTASITGDGPEFFAA
jgi:hypothetical protein